MNWIKAKVVALTQPILPTVDGPEELVAYTARVSSGREEEDRGKDYEGLLNYCIRNKHWSVFEMANAVVEVEAPRDISRQLLRHRSFSFQEFSQRYSADIKFTTREARLQDKTNRQNSLVSEDKMMQEMFKVICEQQIEDVGELYRGFVDHEGIAKECARVVLPEGLTMSRLYVNGTLRSWLHYLDIRDDEGVTQWEHVLLARAIKEVLVPHFPTIIKVSE